jgi:response regulator RpfG family c-di-GMP phosphodiesterase
LKKFSSTFHEVNESFNGILNEPYPEPRLFRHPDSKIGNLSKWHQTCLSSGEKIVEVTVKRILIVDDEPSILLSLSHFLRSDEVTVVTCSRIEEAEEALDRYRFDLAIADIRLSGVYGIEGLELLSYIKKISPGTEVIIMTAYGSDEVKEAAYRRGAYHYFEKPIDMNDLVGKVEALGIKVTINRGKGGVRCRP